MRWQQEQKEALPSFRRSRQPAAGSRQQQDAEHLSARGSQLHLFWHNLNASSVVILSKIEIVFATHLTSLPPAPAPPAAADESVSSMQFSQLRAGVLILPQHASNSGQLPSGAALCYFTFGLNVNLYSICFPTLGCCSNPSPREAP